ncbi:hypothetical protein ACPV51_20450 [Vibrio astriarenae]
MNFSDHCQKLIEYTLNTMTPERLVTEKEVDLVLTSIEAMTIKHSHDEIEHQLINECHRYVTTLAEQKKLQQASLFTLTRLKQFALADDGHITELVFPILATTSRAITADIVPLQLRSRIQSLCEKVLELPCELRGSPIELPLHHENYKNRINKLNSYRPVKSLEPGDYLLAYPLKVKGMVSNKKLAQLNHAMTEITKELSFGQDPLSMIPLNISSVLDTLLLPLSKRVLKALTTEDESTQWQIDGDKKDLIVVSTNTKQHEFVVFDDIKLPIIIDIARHCLESNIDLVELAS